MPSSIWKTTPTLEELNGLCRNTLISHLGIVFSEVGDDYLQAVMPLGAHLMQTSGIMHGGASCVLAETVGSAAANYCIDQTVHICVGLDINTNHIRAAQVGVLTATGKPYHLGGLTQVWSIEIHNEQEQLISASRLTVITLRKPV